jgi:uncharacterized membrane protein
MIDNNDIKNIIIMTLSNIIATYISYNLLLKKLPSYAVNNPPI